MTGYTSSSHYDYPDDSGYGLSHRHNNNSYDDDVYEGGFVGQQQHREPSHFQLNEDTSSSYHTPHSGRRHTWASPPPPKLSSSGDLVVYSGDSPSSPLSAAGTDVSPFDDTTNSSGPFTQAMVPYDDNNMAMVVYNEDGIKNPSALPQKIVKMKKNRRRATVGAGVVGGVVGLVALGPVGGVVGGVGAAVVTKQLGKRREKKKLQKLSDQEIARQHQDAPDVEVHTGEFL